MKTYDIITLRVSANGSKKQLVGLWEATTANRKAAIVRADEMIEEGLNTELNISRGLSVVEVQKLMKEAKQFLKEVNA